MEESLKNQIFQYLMQGSHPLPGLWRFLLPEDFQYLSLPEEPDSACSHCPQVEARDFRPDYRCCTYYPRIPNFMLGLALMEGTSSTVDLIQDQIRQHFILPEGSQASPLRWTRSIIQNSQDLFGKGDDILCPYLIPEMKMCGLHKFRNSVCSTFFCEFSHGQASESFWDQLQSLMLQIETALGQWCMESLGFDLDQYSQTFGTWSSQLDACSLSNGAWADPIYSSLWHDWQGNPQDFFLACAQLVIDHHQSLFDIAAEFPIRQFNSFEKACYEAVPSQFHKERDREPFVAGDPVPIRQLWYELQAQHKNLWYFPLDETIGWDENLELNLIPRDAAVPVYYRNRPYRLKFGARYFYLSQEAAEALKMLEPCRVLDAQLLEDIEKLGLKPRHLLAEWLNKGWVRLQK